MNNKQVNFKGKLIFKKYKILQYLDKGTYGSVYLGKNIQNNNLHAIKIQKDPYNILEEETFIQYNLKGFGIPEVISFGKFINYNILIETLLGKSIEKIWIAKNKKLDIKDVCMIAIQTLERIEFVHSKNYLHRDIKPSNFLVGNPDSSIIYLIDFGNARKYRSSRTGKHIQSSKNNKVYGTVCYLSINSLRGNEQSRKDDLESLGYMYISLVKGNLPWSDMKNLKIEEIVRKTLTMKEKTSLEDLCKDLPKEFYDYMNYTKNLKFAQKPDYNYLKSLFTSTLSKLGLKNDNVFTWVKRKISKINITNKISGNLRRRVSPQKRLLNSINFSRANKDNTFLNYKSSDIINTINIDNNDNFLEDNKGIYFEEKTNSQINLKENDENKKNLKRKILINISKNENNKIKNGGAIPLQEQGNKNLKILYKKLNLKNSNNDKKFIIRRIAKNNIIENNIYYIPTSFTNKNSPLKIQKNEMNKNIVNSNLSNNRYFTAQYIPLTNRFPNNSLFHNINKFYFNEKIKKNTNIRNNNLNLNNGKMNSKINYYNDEFVDNINNYKNCTEINDYREIKPNNYLIINKKGNYNNK